MEDLALNALSNTVAHIPVVALLAYAIKWLDGDCKVRIKKMEDEIKELRLELKMQVKAYQDYIISKQ